MFTIKEIFTEIISFLNKINWSINRFNIWKLWTFLKLSTSTFFLLLEKHLHFGLLEFAEDFLKHIYFFFMITGTHDIHDTVMCMLPSKVIFNYPHQATKLSSPPSVPYFCKLDLFYPAPLAPSTSCPTTTHQQYSHISHHSISPCF